jgi:hypothetical protein
MEPGLFVLILVAVAVAAFWIYQKERERREELQYLAMQLELDFDPAHDRSHHRRYGHAVFGRGRKRVASNTLRGVRPMAGHPVRVKMGDYRYTTGSGKNAQTHKLSYAIFHLPYVGTPDLLVRREHLGDKLKGGLGFDDIDFESEEFSRQFWVTSSDRKYAYDVLHPRMMRFLLDGSRPHVEIVRDACLVLEGRRRWTPEQFAGWVAWAEEFLSLWPEHLTARLSTRDPWMLE